MARGGAILALACFVCATTAQHTRSLDSRGLDGGPGLSFLQEGQKGAESSDRDAYTGNSAMRTPDEVNAYTIDSGTSAETFTVGVMRRPASVGEAARAAPYASASAKKYSYNSATFASGGKKTKANEESAVKKAQQVQNKASEKEHKKATVQLTAKANKLEVAEVKHKESEKVHKNYIKMRLRKKERKVKKKELAEKGEIVKLTQELNSKSLGKKRSLAGPKGGAMTSSGSFKLSSKFIEGKKAERKSKREMSRKQEKRAKALSRKKEMKRKKEASRKKERIADAAERIEKRQAAAEKRSKKVARAKRRESMEKAKLGVRKMQEKETKAKKQAPFSSGGASFSSGTPKKGAFSSGSAKSGVQQSAAQMFTDDVSFIQEMLRENKANVAKHTSAGKKKTKSGTRQMVAGTSYTSKDLRKMLKKARAKKKYWCKAAEKLPLVANKAKQVSDQQYLESKPAQVKGWAKINKLGKIERSKYKERKDKAYLKSKETFTKASNKAKKASAGCEDARKHYDTLRRKIAEAKSTGFVKGKLPSPAFDFTNREVKMYPNCRRIMATRVWQRWLAMKTDRDLTMAKKELACRNHKLSLERTRVNAWSATVKSVKQSLHTLKGATRCVLNPAVKRMFGMLNGETKLMGSKIKSFIKAVELQRKIVDKAKGANTAELFYTREERDRFARLKEPQSEGSEDQGDLGETASTQAQNGNGRADFDEVELGADLANFENSQIEQYDQKEQAKAQAMARMRKAMEAKTQEVRTKNEVQRKKGKAAESERDMKSNERTSKKAPPAKYKCLYEEFTKSFGPSAKQRAVKFRMTRSAVNSQLGKLKNLMNKAAKEEGKPTKTEAASRFERLGSTVTAPASQMFLSSRNLPIEKGEESTDLGESTSTGSGAPGGCSAFYAMAGPKKGQAKRKKLKVGLPPPTGQEEELGESATVNAAPVGKKVRKARNSRDLRLKILVYIRRMSRRAASISHKMLRDARRKLTKANIKYKNLKTQVKNAQSLVKVERQKLGSDESLAQGRCLGNTCFKGIMLKAYHGGQSETWVCRRGLGGTKDTRNAFSCKMKTGKGELRMCVGKEIWFGTFFVPMMKELTCPKDMTAPCSENKQCGSDGMPLTRDFMQVKLRNECMQL